MLNNEDIPTTKEDVALRHIKSISWQRTAIDVVKTGDAYGQRTIDALITLGVPAEAIICDTKRKPGLLRVEGQKACEVMQGLNIVSSYWSSKIASPASPAMAGR